MRLIGRDKLLHLRDRGGQIEKWLHSWVAEVMNAHWKQPSDVSNQFPNARHGGNGHFMFSVAKCKWVIHLFIAFPQGIALITDLKTDDDTHGN